LGLVGLGVLVLVLVIYMALNAYDAELDAIGQRSSS